MLDNQPPQHHDDRHVSAQGGPHNTLCPTRDNRVGEDGIDWGTEDACCCKARNETVRR
jgi:hypothetical protein